MCYEGAYLAHGLVTTTCMIRFVESAILDTGSSKMECLCHTAMDDNKSSYVSHCLINTATVGSIFNILNNYKYVDTFK